MNLFLNFMYLITLICQYQKKLHYFVKGHIVEELIPTSLPPTPSYIALQQILLYCTHIILLNRNSKITGGQHYSAMKTYSFLYRFETLVNSRFMKMS